MSINAHIHYNYGTVMSNSVVIQCLLALPFILVLAIYVLFVAASCRKKSWPLYRTAFWSLGTVMALTSVAGPLANLAHTNFIAHMLNHLLLGMLAPLLMALGAPMTLIMKTLRTPIARKLTRILKSWPVGLLTHPITTTLLNIGGLWLLYTTNLYSLMHVNAFLYLLIHFHIFIAGYLFTVSFIYIDPTVHRFSFLYRSNILVISLAAHGVLSKIIYVYPPTGVPLDQAKPGSMLMYYGGDAIDVLIIFLLCLQWYRATRPRSVVALS